jgi:uncharacterized protein YcbK (DUF882 family)
MSAPHQHAFIAAICCALLAPVAAAAAEVCANDPGADFARSLEQPVCRPGAPAPKVDKPLDTTGASPRRRGVIEIAATLFNVHTREALPIFAGRLPTAQALARFFRCRGFGLTRDLDPRLLEQALAAAAEFEAPRIEVISAYRSPKMNETLAKKGRKVASESRHTQGQALDFRVVGTPARRVGEWIWARFEGGVGIYDRDDFVHIDVGPKRRWNAR